MNKIVTLHIGDFHFSPKNKDICMQNAIAIRDAAIKHNVDFIIDAGDWWDAPSYASEKGAIKIALDIMKMWAAVAPVCGIYGTPSHQSPSSMEIFRDYFTVLEPGKVYGAHGLYNRITEIGKSQQELNCIIFGIPEVTKTNIQAKLGLSAEEANAKAEELYYQYVDSFIAPMRLKYKEVPAVCAVHGNFSDSKKELSNDMILKSSDIVIHNERLRGAEIDYFYMSHIHKPSQFTKIPGGYCGSWGKDWNETGFVPGFNLVTIENGKHSIERIPYGTPERRKVSLPFNGWKPEIAYKVVTSDKTFKLPENVHLWSVIEHKPEERTTKRVTHEQAQEVKSLWDWFLLADTKVKKSLKKLVDEIPAKNTNDIAKKNIRVDLKSVEVNGCVFFKGKNINFNISELPQSLVGIAGDNGDGKSSLLSFCTPYPVIAGKLPTSGRQSAIWEFFNQQESMIKKVFTVNGQNHEHLITIRGAHTKSPKTECYLTIDGVPQLELATFDEIMKKCEELYGSYNDYLITTFYVQPQQGGKETNLMNAPMTEIRNIVQNIAGIDYSSQKEYANSMKSETEKKANDIKRWIEIKENDIESGYDLDVLIEDKKQNICIVNIDIQKTIENGKTAKAEMLKLQDLNTKNESNMNLKRSLNADIHAANNQLHILQSELSELLGLSQELETLETMKAEHDKNASRIAELEREQNKFDAANNKINSTYDKAYNEWLQKKKEIELEKKNKIFEIKRLENIIKSKEELYLQVNIPCEYCGKLSSSADDKIKSLTKEIDDIKNSIKIIENMKESFLPDFPEKQPDYIFDATELNNLKGKELIDINELTEQIAKARTSANRITEINTGISGLNNTITDKTKQVNDIVIDETIRERLRNAMGKVDKLSFDYRNLSDELSTLNAELKSLQEKLEQSEKLKAEIKTKKSEHEKLESLAKDWQYIAGMLAADKIPAIELETIIDMIDQDATDILRTFQDGRYSVKTVTQIEGKKKTVDKFDIMIHDAETGQEKSFMKWSPGERSFPSDAYVKALVKQRMRRHNVIYSPIVLDEIDGPVSPERVGMFYDMQNAYYSEFDIPVLVVTHSSNSQQYIENRILVEDLKK